MAYTLEKTSTPGIFKRGSPYVFIYRANGRQKWESARTLEDARRAKAARVTDVGCAEVIARESDRRSRRRVLGACWSLRHRRMLGRSRDTGSTEPVSTSVSTPS
jgi:hypothetical protein